MKDIERMARDGEGFNQCTWRLDNNRFLTSHLDNAGHLEEMGAALVRTLLDYWAPPELNSAADLCSQLDAALLQGVTDTAGTNTGSSGSSGGPAVMGATFEKLLLGDGGEDEDVCTDSDDESSDDDKLTSSTARRGSAATTAPSQPAVGAVSSGGVDGGGSNGSSAASLADISRQLAELLGSKGAAAESGRALGAAGGGAAAGAVKSLLEAIRASEGSANAGAAAAAVPAPSNADKAKPAQAVAAGASSSSTVTGGGSAGSSSKQAGMAQTQTQAVTAAAQHLLDKLAVAKAKVQAGAVVVTPGASPAVAATGDRGSNVGPAVSLKAVSAVGGAAAAAVASSSCPTAVTSEWLLRWHAGHMQHLSKCSMDTNHAYGFCPCGALFNPRLSRRTHTRLHTNKTGLSNHIVCVYLAHRPWCRCVCLRNCIAATAAQPISRHLSPSRSDASSRLCCSSSSGGRGSSSRCTSSRCTSIPV